MRPQILHSARRPSVERIEALGQEYGLMVPTPFVRFLRRTNGGDPVPAGFRMPGGAEGRVQSFLSLGGRKKFGLQETMASLAGRLPAGLLAIACTPEWNLICLSGRTEDVGRVYLWSRSDEGGGADAVVELSPTLDDFLESFYAPPVTEAEWKRMCNRGERARVEAVLSSPESLPNASTQLAEGARFAAAHGHVEVVGLLLDKGVAIGGLLTVAARHGHVRLVDFLLDRGADVDERSDDLRATPLMMAAAHGYADVAERLIARGADVNATNKFGKTAKVWALWTDQAQVSSVLERAPHGGSKRRE